MSELVPTDEEVRAAWRIVEALQYDRSWSEGESRFDRWLADHDARIRDTYEIGSQADWSAAWTELYGYVTEAAADGEGLDAEHVRDYMRELKARHVTGPVRAELRRLAGDTDGT